MLLLEIQGSTQSTLFAKMKDVYPECMVLIEGAPQLHPLRCMRDHCPRNLSCMEKLAKRVKHLFDKFPRSQLLVLYYTWPDRPGSQRAGLFWRDMREPRHIVMNRSAWEKCKELGVVFEYRMPDELFFATRQAG